MTHSTSTDQLFNGTVEDTWEVLVAIEAYPERTTSYVDVTPLTDSLRGLGARWEQTRTVWGRSHTQTMEVVGWDPPASFTLRASEAGARYETSYRLTAEQGGTRVNASFQVTPTNVFGRLVNRIMGGKLLKSSGEALAQILEELSASMDT